MTPRIVAVSLCLLAMCAAGCDLAVGLGRGIADAVFMFLLVVASIIGLAGGVGLAVALSARGRLGVAHVLFASVAGFGVAAFLFSTNDGLHVRPTFAFHARDLWLLWLPTPIVVWPLWATARFVAERLAARAGEAATQEPRWPRIPAGVLSALWIGFLVYHSVPIPPPPLPAPYATVAMTDHESYGLLADGTLIQWRYGFAQAYKKRFGALAAGRDEACAITTDGELGCGPGLEMPVPAGVARHVREVAVGPAYACALGEAGDVLCWSLNDCRAQRCSAAIPIEGLDATMHVAVGRTMACALRRDGTVACWGFDDSFGWAPEDKRVPAWHATLLRGFAGAARIAVRENLLCALTREGEVACAGDNEWQQAGASDGSWVAAPRRIDGISRAVDLALGDFHGCVRQEDGAIACWGGNGWGQLGDDRREERRSIAGRIELPGRARWLAISAAASCAELESGEAWCWGAASEEAGVIHGERCSGGLFGPWRICSSKPVRMSLPKTAIPFEALKPK